MGLRFSEGLDCVLIREAIEAGDETYKPADLLVLDASGWILNNFLSFSIEMIELKAIIDPCLVRALQVPNKLVGLAKKASSI